MARIWRTGGRKWGWLVGAPAGAGLSVVTSLWLGKLRPRGGQQPALKFRLWSSCFGLFPHTEGLPWQGCHQVVASRMQVGCVGALLTMSSCTRTRGGGQTHGQALMPRMVQKHPLDAVFGCVGSLSCCPLGFASPCSYTFSLGLLIKYSHAPCPQSRLVTFIAVGKFPAQSLDPWPRQSPARAPAQPAAPSQRCFLLAPPGQMSSCADRQQSAQVRVRKHPKIPL